MTGPSLDSSARARSGVMTVASLWKGGLGLPGWVLCPVNGLPVNTDPQAWPGTDQEGGKELGGRL